MIRVLLIGCGDVALRTAECDVVGAGGPTRSTPPVIDLANRRLRLNFILPVRLEQYYSKFLADRGYICVMVTDWKLKGG